MNVRAMRRQEHGVDGVEREHPAAAAAAHAHAHAAAAVTSDSGETLASGDEIHQRRSNASLASEVDELKARLASTATQLTTTEDELRQRVDVEGSLRFAVDVLRTRLVGMQQKATRSSRDGNGNTGNVSGASSERRCPEGGSGGGTTTDDGEEEIESVQELLIELGLGLAGGGDGACGSSDPRVELAARRDAADSELRTEGLQARLAESDQARRRAEARLAGRESTVRSLQSKIDLLRTRLTETEGRASVEKARLEELLAASKQSEAELRDELDHFKTQLTLVAGLQVAQNAERFNGPLPPHGDGSMDRTEDGMKKPFDETPPGGTRREYQFETPCATVPRGQQMHASDAEVLEARAKAKVLLSLRKEADLSYQGSINDLETMIAHVYTKELQNELRASSCSSSGGNNDGPPAVPKDRGLERLHDMSTQKLDRVSDDFKKLLIARDKMLKFHAKIQKQCNAILAMSDATNELEIGEWDVSQVHPVLPGAC